MFDLMSTITKEIYGETSQVLTVSIAKIRSKFLEVAKGVHTNAIPSNGALMHIGVVGDMETTIDDEPIIDAKDIIIKKPGPIKVFSNVEKNAEIESKEDI